MKKLRALIATLLVCLFALNSFGLTPTERANTIKEYKDYEIRERAVEVLIRTGISGSICGATVVVPLITAAIETVPVISFMLGLTFSDKYNYNPWSRQYANEIGLDLHEDDIASNPAVGFAKFIGFFSLPVDIVLSPVDLYNLFDEDGRAANFLYLTRANYKHSYLTARHLSSDCADSVEILGILLGINE